MHQIGFHASFCHQNPLAESTTVLASNQQMLMSRLRARTSPFSRRSLIRAGFASLCLLMTVQFVGCYLFLGRPYIDFHRFGHGYERLPFQTRLLLAPLFRWALESPFMLHYASHWSSDNYFFPRGIGPGGVLELFIDIPCVIVAGWATLRIYQAASQRRLFDWLIYPFFLILCVVTYTLHAVQNFRFLYDFPSLAFFALGLYLIYFRKSAALFVSLFAVATLNRETTLLLIPFYLLSACLPSAPPGDNKYPQPTPINCFDPAAHSFNWRRALKPEVAFPVLLMLAYWTAWHVYVFHLFRHNVSEYYPRLDWNWRYLTHVRYYPQLLSAGGYLLPFLFVFRKKIDDRQLRLWIWVIPAWFALMTVWGLLVETRIFGELIPLITCGAALIAEEALVSAVHKNTTVRDLEEDNDSLAVSQAA
jgi:hypothetical protein